MSKEGEFTSYIIQDMSETPGLGTKATEPKFKDEFDEIDYFGSNPPKVTKDGGQVDSISGATISSRAICNGVGEALQFTLKHKETIMNFNAGSLPVQKEGE
jgi:electron transport complex protein RnfG